jgi:hypothetical protein
MSKNSLTSVLGHDNMSAESSSWDKAEQAILCALASIGITVSTGSVTIHVHRGRICDYEKTEKAIRKKKVRSFER